MTSERGTTQPLKVWKLLVLLLATATLYQFFWFYTLARELNRSRQLNLTPWHWVAAPLLGPFLFLPAHFLASRLQDWQVEERAEMGHLAEPVLVVTLVIIAYVPLYLIAYDTGVWPIAAVWVSLLLCLPYLALQGQLNLNLAGSEPGSESGSGQALFSKYQVAGMLAGLIVAVPLYAYVFTDTWELRGSNALAVGEVVEPASGAFRVVVGDEGWTNMRLGNLSEEADLEFLGPDEWTWAIVYNSAGSSVDDILMYRTREALQLFRGAKCSGSKSLDADTMTVLGGIECEGRNLIDGSFIYVSRVLRNDDAIVEIIASTAQSNPDHYDGMAARVRQFVAGLELTE